MADVQGTLFLSQRIDETVAILQQYEPEEGYYLAFSGGLDSVTLERLATVAGVRFDAHFHRSGADPHQTVQFIKSSFPDTMLHKPETTIFELIIEHGVPPTRLMRYCCRPIKETDHVQYI